VRSAASDDRYKWIALSNATLAVLLATLDGSITIIAMPDIFRGIHLDPLVPSNSFYLLWMILGYLVVTSVLIVSLGRLGDMVGRVRIYNLGFVIYTAASLMLAVDWLDGRGGATYLIVFRVVQGIGGACLLANAAAIITDAFPANQRGMALGINNIVGVSTATTSPTRRCGRASTCCPSPWGCCAPGRRPATSPIASARARSRPRGCCSRPLASGSCSSSPRTSPIRPSGRSSC